MKFIIPVVVTPNGEIGSAFACKKPGKEQEEQDWDTPVECLEPESFALGFAVVFVEVEIDIDTIFKSRTAQGKVVAGKIDAKHQ